MLGNVGKYRQSSPCASSIRLSKRLETIAEQQDVTGHVKIVILFEGRHFETLPDADGVIIVAIGNVAFCEIVVKSTFRRQCSLVQSF